MCLGFYSSFLFKDTSFSVIIKPVKMITTRKLERLRSINVLCHFSIKISDMDVIFNSDWYHVRK